MDGRWESLGPLSDFVEGQPVLRKVAKLRLACVRQGNGVFAIADRCPHQGYPLSQGTVHEGVLTCQWHNWKFDLASGACQFGGEPVLSYATRVDDGRVLVDLARDPADDAGRFESSLREALRDADTSRALRDALRLSSLGEAPDPDAQALGSLHRGLECLVRDAARRARWGFDHDLAVTADLCGWVERGWLEAGPAFVLAATAVGDASKNLPERAPPEPRSPDRDDDPSRVSAALSGERRAEAEALVTHLARSLPAHDLAQSLLPFVARHLYDYGHGAIFLLKATELGERFPRALAEVFGSLAVSLGWATAETALPPFSLTGAAIQRVLESDPVEPKPSSLDRAWYESDVLDSERAAIAATEELLAAHHDPRALLRASGHAAAVRLGRFDPAWERDPEADVSVLGVSHAVTFAQAAGELAEGAEPRLAGALALQAAGFVGKLRRADRSDGAEPPVAVAASPGELPDAARSRDVGRALGAVRGLGAEARLRCYRELADYAAFDAFVRPIRYAHAIKTLEALYRLERNDPEADHVYLEALISMIVPRRPEDNARRVSRIAQKFFADGRPPRQLY